MVIDTSAIVAMLFREPDAEVYLNAIVTAESLCISTANVLECALVIENRHGAPGAEKLDTLLREQDIEIVSFDPDQLALARSAFRRFGRGRHSAALNFGDCFSYALAKARGLPLLFKGNDFTQTDIESVL